MKNCLRLLAICALALLFVSALYTIDLGPGDAIHIQCSTTLIIEEPPPGNRMAKHAVNIVCAEYTPTLEVTTPTPERETR